MYGSNLLPHLPRFCPSLIYSFKQYQTVPCLLAGTKQTINAKVVTQDIFMMQHLQLQLVFFVILP